MAFVWFISRVRDTFAYFCACSCLLLQKPPEVDAFLSLFDYTCHVMGVCMIACLCASNCVCVVCAGMHT